MNTLCTKASVVGSLMRMLGRSFSRSFTLDMTLTKLRKVTAMRRSRYGALASMAPACPRMTSEFHRGTARKAPWKRRRTLDPDSWHTAPNMAATVFRM